MLILLASSGWAYVDIWAANRRQFPSFYPMHFAAWSAVFLSLGLGVTWVTYRFVRSGRRADRAYASGVLAVLSLQSWKWISELFDRLETSTGVMGATLLLGVGLLIGLYLFIRLVAGRPAGRALIGVLVAFLVGYQYLVVAQFSFEQLFDTPAVAQSRSTGTASVMASPDVLVVVLDAYGRSDVLEEIFQHDNSSFETSLSELGVNVVTGAKANYSLTRLSVSGLLDGRYPSIGQPDDASLEDLQRILSGENALFASLQASGYETHLFDNAWTFASCSDSVDVCHTTLVNDLDHAVLSRTPAVDMFPSAGINPWVRGSVEQLRQAARLLEEPSEQPRLVFVHALIPHAPFQLDAQCRERFDPRLSQFEPGSSKDVPGSAYVDQLRCVNSLVLDLLGALPDDGIALVTGDHGPRWAGGDVATNPGVSDIQLLTRIATFTGYRFPEDCGGIEESASLMNVSAHLFSCLGVPITAEPVRDPRQSPLYYSQSSTDAPVIDITDRVSQLP